MALKDVLFAQALTSEWASIVNVSAVSTRWPGTSLHVTRTHHRGHLSNTDDTSQIHHFIVLYKKLAHKIRIPFII